MCKIGFEQEGNIYVTSSSIQEVLRRHGKYKEAREI